MPLRINLVSEHASPLALIGGVDAGGQNVHVAALAVGLAELGAEVVVHTRRDDPALDRRVRFAEGVVVDHVDAGPPAPIDKDEMLPYMGDFADDLVRQWRRSRPDVAHAHFWMSGLATTAAADRLDVPVALTFHARGAEKRAHQGAADASPDIRIDAEDWLAKSVDRVIATTSAECRTLTRAGVDPRRVSVVPCGVDLAAFGPDGPQWPTRTRPYRVVCVSRLVPRKGLADVIEAVAELPHVELLIAGGPPAGLVDEDPYARRLQALIDDSASGDRIHLLGAVDRDRIPSLLRSADLVVCTPWYEPFGIVAVEAMACGVPVIASAVGGLAETVVDGVTGVLVPPRRPQSIRAAISALLAQRTRRAGMGRAALARASTYGWDEIAARTLRLLEGLAAADHPRRRAGFGNPLAAIVDRSDELTSGGRS
jgi:D-inositol-3-phosphate glycosyltransferase